MVNLEYKIRSIHCIILISKTNICQKFYKLTKKNSLVRYQRVNKGITDYFAKTTPLEKNFTGVHIMFSKTKSNTYTLIQHK